MNFYRNQSNCLPFSVPMFPFSHLMINIILFSNQIIKRKLSKFRRDYQSLLQFAEILPIAGAKPGFQFLPPVGRDGMATEAKPEANRRTLFSRTVGIRKSGVIPNWHEFLRTPYVIHFLKRELKEFKILMKSLRTHHKWIFVQHRPLDNCSTSELCFRL